MISHDCLQILNSVISIVIVGRLLAFRRDGATHRPIAGWIAYLTIVACASVPIRTLLGYFVFVDWSDILIKLLLCIAVLRTRGNVMQLFKISR